MKIDKESIYLKMPVRLQNVLCSVAGFKNLRTRYDAEFYELLKEMETRTLYSDEQLQDFQNQRLRSFVQHAYDTVPFYKLHFDQAQLDPLSLIHI